MVYIKTALQVANPFECFAVGQKDAQKRGGALF
jgi:hypothetical protein